VYRRVYILLCCCSCSWEAFNQTGQYFGYQIFYQTCLDRMKLDLKFWTYKLITRNPTNHTMCPVDTATAGSWAGVGLVN
jgi:hypothetical protein